jgi:RNA polymerase sigma-70 factor (TIGR02960 family)
MMDRAAFDTAAGRHRRELHVHCYRMLGSFDEAEDAVQEALLHAWRGRDSFDRGPGLRAWLYRIATNCCLDTLRRRARRPRSASYDEMPWLQPYPDRLLDEIPGAGGEPDAVAIARETIELAFIAVIGQLPPKQRAALLLCDVLGWSAQETAALLQTSLGAANSALARARATMAAGHDRTPPAQSAPPRLSPREQEILDLFVDIHEGSDPARAAALLSEDVRVTMPPHPWCYRGRAQVLELIRGGTGAAGPGEWRLVPTRANRLAAAGCYLRAWDSDEFVAFKIDVIDVRDGLIAQITTFDATMFDAFGLAPILANAQLRGRGRR